MVKLRYRSYKRVYVKYGDVTTLQSNNENNSSVSGAHDTTDYTDFSVDRDRCGIFERPICKKTRHLSDMKNTICLWTNRSCAGMTCQQRVDELNKNIGEENLNGGKWIALNPQRKCDLIPNGTILVSYALLVD